MNKTQHTQEKGIVYAEAGFEAPERLQPITDLRMSRPECKRYFIVRLF